MNKMTLSSLYLVFLLMVTNLIILSTPAFGEGFDLILTDPENDVEDMEIGIVQGYDQIDIIELKSSENLLETQLILEFSVKGVITDSDTISYSIEIMSGKDYVYYIYYSNGTCIGSNNEDGTSDILQASGSGTSTLEIRVQKTDLGDISDFNMSGSSMEFSDDYEQICTDWIPDYNFPDPYPYYDLPIMITEPKPNATASSTKLIEGVCDISFNIESVEIQIDSMQDGEWKAATTQDNWETWEYSWDTTKFPDGRSTIYARGFNGNEYFYDSISVFVNQSNAISPPTTDVPALNVGLELEYEMTMANMFGGEIGDGSYEMTSTMSLSVNRKEKIRVDGIEYETYKIQTRIEMNITISFDNEEFQSSSFVLGTQWIRTEDLATIKTYMSTTYSAEGFEETTTSVSTYDPIYDTYNFPMSVSESWTSSFTEHIEETYDWGWGDENDTFSYDASFDCEVLHFKRIDVPAGSFDTFAIYSKETSQEYYGQGTPFFGVMDGYSVNYYSPKFGFPVKTEQYSSNRELMMTLELTSYSESKITPDMDSDPKGDEIPFYFILIPIFIIVILAAAFAARKRRKRLAQRADQGQYTTNTGYQTPATYPNSIGYSQSPQTPSTPYSYPPPPPPPPPGHSVQSTQTQTSTPLQNVTPIMQIQCPKCFNTFTVSQNSGNVQCPFCGVRGRL
jgi:ribosomal protein S27E